MKKNILLTSLVVFCLGYVSESWAEEGMPIASGDNCGTNCSWSISSDGVLSIFVTEGATSGSMNSFSDTASKRAPWYEYKSSISSISIEGKKTDTNGDTIANSGITSVGSYAFYNVPAKSIDIPDSIKSLGSYVFWGSNVESVEIPDSVTSFGTGVFRDAKSLTSVTLPDNMTSIPNQMFLSCEKLANITLPESLTSIGESVFATTKNLHSIIIPKDVTTIGFEAFGGTWWDRSGGLETIEFEEGSKLETIGAMAFWGATAKSINLPDTVTSIGNNAFSNSLIESLFLPESVTTLGNNVFGGSGYGKMDKLTQLYCPKNLETICQARLETASLSSSILNTYESKGGIYALTDSEGNVSYFDSLANLKGGTACENIILCKATYMAAENDVCSEISECAEMISNCPIGTHLQNLSCVDNPEGCADFANGACSACDNNYYKKENGCVSSSEGCGEDYLEKDNVCISASLGCGEGYKNMGGWCNRIRYTPAEAAEVLTDDNNNSVTITFKK